MTIPKISTHGYYFEFPVKVENLYIKELNYLDRLMDLATVHFKVTREDIFKGKDYYKAQIKHIVIELFTLKYKVPQKKIGSYFGRSEQYVRNSRVTFKRKWKQKAFRLAYERFREYVERGSIKVDNHDQYKNSINFNYI